MGLDLAQYLILIKYFLDLLTLIRPDDQKVSCFIEHFGSPQAFVISEVPSPTSALSR
mgnify:FL=1